MSSNLKNPKMSEPGVRAILKLDSLGLPPSPENYEIFYTAFAGLDPKLGAALRLLGDKPTQAEVDEVGLKFFPNRAAESFAQQATGRMGRELDALSNTLNIESKNIGSFKAAVSTAVDRYVAASANGPISQDSLGEFAEALRSAAGDRYAAGTKTVKDISAAADEMNRLQDEVDLYKKLANTDKLTGLNNRRVFDESIAAVYSDGNPTGSLIVMDIDRFKNINDTYGHPVGDYVIASIANRIKALVRGRTFVARTGGEEFAVIIQDTDRGNDLEVIGERIRAGVENLLLEHPKTGARLPTTTVSIGVCRAGDATDGGDLYEKADQALYASKHRGRNTVSFYEPPAYEADDGRRYNMIYGR
jgi:diguanylate cyclase